ncbi:hypothetical protein POM88_024371 [Heracleum sosnowskyi]|uniref:Oxidoreductase N-terminal domain-containing protein n=1 Tax=Heracleum sosnowskyi TaxID=360622 RepID=A0AAD8MLW1_9APIA|nr:hypothetical protein POM88_024371 [Heracleum sosnowskyi]
MFSFPLLLQSQLLTDQWFNGVALGQAIDAYGVAKVVASGHPDFEKDDLVIGLISWGEYSIVKEGSILNKLNSLGFPYSYHVGILGLIITDIEHSLELGAWSLFDLFMVIHKVSSASGALLVSMLYQCSFDR